MGQTLRLITVDVDSGKRLDKYLASTLERISRSQLKKLISDGHVVVDGEIPQKAGYKLKGEEEITVTIPDPEPLDVKAEDIPIAVLYEDKDLIVVNKSQGIVVHPAPGHRSGTLVNALLAHCQDLSGINGVLRPGIVHRLDKDTSGALVVAKSDFAHASLAAQIKQHTVLRKYHAIVHGCPSTVAATIKMPIGRHPIHRKKMAVVRRGGRMAISKYRILERLGQYSLIEVQLETGRTHQVRVHMAYIGNPLVGDPLYGPKRKHFDIPGQALHAQQLGFVHPRTQEYRVFTAPKPNVMESLLARLRRAYST